MQRHPFHPRSGRSSGRETRDRSTSSIAYGVNKEEGRAFPYLAVVDRTLTQPDLPRPPTSVLAAILLSFRTLLHTCYYFTDVMSIDAVSIRRYIVSR